MSLYLILLVEWILITNGLCVKPSESQYSTELDYGVGPIKGGIMDENMNDNNKSPEDYPTSDEIRMMSKSLKRTQHKEKQKQKQKKTPKRVFKTAVARTEAPQNVVKSTTAPTTPWHHTVEDQSLKSVNVYACEEVEIPLTVGRYKLPTIRDMLIITKQNLIKYFDIYQKKASVFLQDIKLATTELIQTSQFCTGTKVQAYEKCFKDVKGISALITKNLRVNLHAKKREVSLYTSENNCDGTIMKERSLNLLKWLAIENLSLDFALPAFLRIMYNCSIQCYRSLILPKKIKLRDQNGESIFWALQNHLKKEH